MAALNTGEDEQDESLIDGASCNCPVDCEETVYFTEMSSARLKSVASLVREDLNGSRTYRLLKQRESKMEAELEKLLEKFGCEFFL